MNNIINGLNVLINEVKEEQKSQKLKNKQIELLENKITEMTILLKRCNNILYDNGEFEELVDEIDKILEV